MASQDVLFDPYRVGHEGFVVVQSWNDWVFDASGDVVRVYGRPDPIVVTDGRPYPSGSLVLVTLEHSEREWLADLLSTGRVIGLRPANPAGFGLPEEVFLYVGKAVMSRVVTRATAVERRWSLDVQVVDRPVTS
jgi:hypothetical protein